MFLLNLLFNGMNNTGKSWICIWTRTFFNYSSVSKISCFDNNEISANGGQGRHSKTTQVKAQTDFFQNKPRTVYFANYLHRLLSFELLFQFKGPT